MPRARRIHRQIQALEKDIRKQLGELSLGSEVKIHQGDLKGEGREFYLGYKEQPNKRAEKLVNQLVTIANTNYRQIIVTEEYDEKARLFKRVLTLNNPEIPPNGEARIRHSLLSKILKELQNYSN